MAVLSGFGAVNTPYTTLFIFLKGVTAEHVAQAERELESTLDMIMEKKKKLTDVIRRRSERENRFLDSKTAKGKLFNVLGYFFSAYCVYKVFSVLTGGTDPVTHMINVAVHWLGYTLDVDYVSQQLSFVFIGGLVVFSIRGVLIQFAKVFRTFSGSISTDSIILFLTHLMGMYFISTVLMMRMNLPPQYRTMMTSALGSISFDYYTRWFDVIFLISAIASIAFIAVIESLQKLDAEKQSWDLGGKRRMGYRAGDGLLGKSYYD
ncbi:Golgi pH regulator B [Phlyctochytrium bullatum]|nr:Golgi pH regulator B [Phlyctochytrium bullatum]